MRQFLGACVKGRLPKTWMGTAGGNYRPDRHWVLSRPGIRDLIPSPSQRAAWRCQAGEFLPAGRHGVMIGR